MTDPRLAELAALLDGRRASPADVWEELSLALFDAALPSLPRPFDESASPWHVTSSAIVTGPEGVLLLRHKRLGIWVQPGGHLEPGEGLAAGATREAVEETGLPMVAGDETDVLRVAGEETDLLRVAGGASPSPPDSPAPPDPPSSSRRSSPLLVHVDVHAGGRGHTHLDLRWWLTTSGVPRPPAGESPDVRWYGWDDAIEVADAGLAGGLVAMRHRLRPAG